MEQILAEHPNVSKQKTNHSGDIFQCLCYKFQRKLHCHSNGWSYGPDHNVWDIFFFGFSLSQKRLGRFKGIIASSHHLHALSMGLGLCHSSGLWFKSVGFLVRRIIPLFLHQMTNALTAEAFQMGQERPHTRGRAGTSRGQPKSHKTHCNPGQY